jgi:hypothetical protein
LVNQRLRAAGNQEVFILPADLMQKLKDQGRGKKKFANRTKDSDSRRSWEKSSLHAGIRTLVGDKMFGQAPDWTSKKRLLIPVNKPGVHWGLLDVAVSAACGGHGGSQTLQPNECAALPLIEDGEAVLHEFLPHRTPVQLINTRSLCAGVGVFSAPGYERVDRERRCTVR